MEKENTYLVVTRMIENTDFANSKDFVWIFLFSEIENLILDFLFGCPLPAAVKL